MITVNKFRNQADEVFGILTYEPDKNYLLMTWIGYSSEEEVKLASTAMIAWQQTDGLKKKCRVHIHDTREIQGAWIGVVDWIKNVMWPLCYQSGLRYNLSITSPDLFSKMSSRALKQQNSNQVTTMLFEKLSSAETWLKEKYKSF